MILLMYWVEQTDDLEHETEDQRTEWGDWTQRETDSEAEEEYELHEY